MAARKKKKLPAKRRLRHVWKIKPQSRVRASRKTYDRLRTKDELRLDLSSDEL
ncbi:MAG: hypothetical protein HY714_02045 [Candidatus Omnitrophica bacterium]|nr:hypothetical protein [Candidatus Omnitrophota bacterium]